MTLDNQRISVAKSLPERLANLSSGRDEMNLCELPFATLSERSSGRKQLEFCIEDYDSTSGQFVKRTLTVKGDPEFGLPTEKDEEIYLALLKYTSDYNRFASPDVRIISRSQLFELMAWPKSDWAYKRLTKGMHRLVGVRMRYQNLWRDNHDKQWKDQGAFGILDSFHFLDSRNKQQRSFKEGYSAFRWGSVLFRSFDSGYLKRIDYELARELSPTARRLYRYLDKHFHPPYKRTITMDVARLGYQHIGISPGITLDKVRKRYLDPAAKELEQAGYLESADDRRFQKVRRGHWEATFTLAANDSGAQTESKNDRVVKALLKRGVTAEKAMSVSEIYQVNEVKTALRAMDEQLRQGTEIRNADHWISAALRNGYKPRHSSSSTKRPNRPELKLFRADD